MIGFPLSAADRDLVGAAVAAAETGTDGEIVTIITRRSDEYRDSGFVWAVSAMLLAVALAALYPAGLDWLITLIAGGWGEAPTMAERLVALMAIEALVFGLALIAFRSHAVRIALTPKRIRTGRVRARAIQYFKVGAERRTVARVGVLLYLSLDEHLAEIVADEAIHARVPPERWGDAMAALVDRVRAGQPGAGMAAAVTAIGGIVAEHFPKTGDDINELPDRLIEL
jgi:putative membrane protein